MRILTITLLTSAVASVAGAQTDWPIYGHDPGGRQYSPLKEIDTRNVSKLKVAWTYDTRPAVVPPPAGAPPIRCRSGAGQTGAAAQPGIASHAVGRGRHDVLVLSIQPHRRARAGDGEENLGVRIRLHARPVAGSPTGVAIRLCRRRLS